MHKQRKNCFWRAIFQAQNQSIRCRELLTLAGLTPEIGNDPEQRSEELYRKRPCSRLVYEAARILEEMLSESQQTDR